jgi:hypothetical protein
MSSPVCSCDFVLCGYLPSQQRLRTLQAAQAQQRKVIEMAAAQSAELSGLERRLRDMENRIEGFDRRVPVDRALGTFLQQIAGLMKDCHLVEQVVLPGKEWKTEDLNLPRPRGVQRDFDKPVRLHEASVFDHCGSKATLRMTPI